ncbi:MAG: dockerin type I domain-containing protein [Phycisphaerales bacterium]
MQSPSLYAGMTWYHMGYYNPALVPYDTEVDDFAGYPFTPGAATDDDWDAFLGTAPQECWSTVSLRTNRFNLDAMHRSTNGRTTPIVPWVPMANEMATVASMETKYDFRGADYDTGLVPVNTSTRYLTRQLAACRARGSNELIQWNWSAFSAEPFHDQYNYGPHSQYPQNWEYFNEAVNNVWGYQIYSTYIDSGATALVVPPSGHPQYGAPVADLVRESDRSYSNTYTGRVRVDSLTGSVGTWFVVTFARDSALAQPADDGTSYLEVDIEGVANVDADCYLYIRGTNTSWVQITDGGTVDHWGSDIRDSGFLMPADRTARIHARIPYDPDLFDGGPCHLALHYKPHSLTGTVSVWTDLVQLYGTHEVKRPAGDINGDYVVDEDDLAMLCDLINNPGHRTKDTDVAAADLNGDGTINCLDYLFYVAASGHYDDPAEDDYMSSFELLRP